MKKKTFYSELAYVFGLLFLAIGAALMERADFGLSTVVAPAYILHLKLSEYAPFFSFGMAEYTLQALLILALALVLRRFKLSYLFVFGTALIYGFLLDGVMLLTALLPQTLYLRVVWYVLGLILCAAGVSFMFHTYLSPEAYELVVKQISAKWKFDINKVKTIYDIISCATGIVLSFCFFGFGHFEGVNVGTIICALVNGWMIGRFTWLYEKVFQFRDGWELRKYFV